MKKTILTPMALIALLLMACLSPQKAFAENKPKQLLVVTVTKGFRHSSIPTLEKMLGELAAKNKIFSVDYARTDEDLAQKMTLKNLEKYDGVIFASTTGDLPLPDKAGFLNWIKSGKAFVGIHSATDTFHGKGTAIDPYIEMIGGEFKTHGAQVQVDCINQDPKHPACQHLGAIYTVTDEIYQFKSFDRAKVHGLLTLDKHPNDGTPGDYPVAWTKNYGKGKVFYTSLGHREDVIESEVYQKHVLGGIIWVLNSGENNAKAGSEIKK